MKTLRDEAENEMNIPEILDYSLSLQDEAGQMHEVFVNADCIRDAMDSGIEFEFAREDVEANAVQNAGFILSEVCLLSRSNEEQHAKYLPHYAKIW